MSVIKVKVTVPKNRNSVPLNYFGLHGPIDVKFIILVAYVKWQLRMATQVSVMKVKVTVSKNRKNVTACNCYSDSWEQGQGHLLTIDFIFLNNNFSTL